MDTEPKDRRTPVMLTQGDVEAIDAWRFQHRAESRSDAIRKLIKLGLETSQSEG